MKKTAMVFFYLLMSCPLLAEEATIEKVVTFSNNSKTSVVIYYAGTEKLPYFALDSAEGVFSFDLPGVFSKFDFSTLTFDQVTAVQHVPLDPDVSKGISVRFLLKEGVDYHVFEDGPGELTLYFEQTDRKRAVAAVSAPEAKPEADLPEGNLDGVHRVVNGKDGEQHLSNLTVDADGSSGRIFLNVDRNVAYKSFFLSEPDRFVLDLNQVILSLEENVIELDLPLVKVIRIRQFQSHPIPVTRMVLDLTEKGQVSAIPVDGGLMVAFARDMDALATVVDAPKDTPATEEVATADTGDKVLPSFEATVTGVSVETKDLELLDRVADVAPAETETVDVEPVAEMVEPVEQEEKQEVFVAELAPLEPEVEQAEPIDARQPVTSEDLVPTQVAEVEEQSVPVETQVAEVVEEQGAPVETQVTEVQEQDAPVETQVAEVAEEQMTAPAVSEPEAVEVAQAEAPAMVTEETAEIAPDPVMSPVTEEATAVAVVTEEPAEVAATEPAPAVEPAEMTVADVPAEPMVDTEEQSIPEPVISIDETPVMTEVATTEDAAPPVHDVSVAEQATPAAEPVEPVVESPGSSFVMATEVDLEMDDFLEDDDNKSFYAMMKDVPSTRRNLGRVVVTNDRIAKSKLSEARTMQEDEDGEDFAELFNEDEDQYDTIDGGEKEYKGFEISIIDVKDANVVDLLRFIADQVGINLYVDSSVGDIRATYRFRNIPWDQALDIILTNANLDKEFRNGVLRVATTEKFKDEERARAELRLQRELSVPVETVTFPLNYAKAREVVPIVSEYLSPRGTLLMDERTNLLIIEDIPNKMTAIRALIKKLDRMISQVTIEARIVETNTRFLKELGIQWGPRGEWSSRLGTDTGLTFPHNVNLGGPQLGIQPPTGPVGGYAVNFPVVAENPSGIGLTLGNFLENFELDISLQLLETEGEGQIISSPKVTTQNNRTAIIRNGSKIPIQTVQRGTVTTRFIDAVLELQVTPQITSDETIIMDLVVDKSEPDFSRPVNGNPIINVSRAETQVLVKNGGTAVIGGIFSLNENHSESGIPGVRKVPILKRLFSSSLKTYNNQELLIFITPRIVKY